MAPTVGFLPCAGKGTRIGVPFPKEFLPVSAGERGVRLVIDSSLSALRSAGVEEIVVVVSPTKREVARYVADRGFRPHVVVQEFPGGTGHAL